METVLAIDIGGTKSLIGIVDENGDCLASKQIPTRVEEGYNVVFKRVIALADEITGNGGFDVKAVGISVPGMVDSRIGTLIYAPYSGWRDVPVKQIAERHMGLPAFVANDVNACALGEMVFGAARGLRDFAWMTISTGIGGGIVIDGRIYEGGRCVAGEFGHLVVEDDGPVCGCGNRGCLEACASGTAIAARASEAVASGEETVMCEPLSAKSVAEAARKGDDVAKRIFEKEALYLGKAFSWIINILNPEMLVIGGGVALAADLFLPHARQICKERVISEANKGIPIVVTKLGYNAGLIGAAALALDRSG